MNEDSKPDSAYNGETGAPNDLLSNALEQLIQDRSSAAPNSPPKLATRTDQALRGGAASPQAGDACPEPGQWALLLAGQTSLADLPEVSSLLAHAADCLPCAERLRILAADESPDETALLAGLATASLEGRRNLAAELARTPHQPLRKSATRLYLWTGAGLAASVLIAVGLSAWWNIANNPERLMADAYTHSRIFDMRMTGAGFAEVTPGMHLRGGSTGRESARLLEARARIEQHLEAAPEDAHWLQLEARSDILEEKFDSAVDILDRLVAAGPVTATLLLDDASAYFLRGAATGSENDRATALDYLRRADELAPSDTVVLFNEALVMEDRGQMMNAAETWNRYLKFERDSRWQAEGRRRLQALEQKLNQLKSHQGRMDQHLASPQAMLALAADSSTLAAIDEELSTTLLPRLLHTAFPSTVDRSRGSPCPTNCQAARTLLYALAASLLRNHQDLWLTQLLPLDPPSSDSSLNNPPDPRFAPAVNVLALAIEAAVHGDYLNAADHAQQAVQLFHAMHNPAGEERAAIERADALQDTANYAGCYAVAHPLLGAHPEFVWIQAQDRALDAYCDPAPGSDAENNPSFLSAESLAHDHRFALIELRVRNMRAGAAVDAGDAESAWRDYLATIREFYAGDYPALRLSGTLSALEQVEQATPRVQLALLLQREHVAALQLTQNKQLLPAAWLNLAAVAIRAGSIDEAQQAMRAAQGELAANGGGKSVQSILAEVQTALANAFLDRNQPDRAGKLLDAAYGNMAGEHNAVYLRNYAVARGQLALEQGHPDAAEPLLRDAILEQERLGGPGGAGAIVQAQQNRDLYAVLAGVWLAQGRSGAQVLALWERYRLRILGIPAPACPDKGLDCLQARLQSALQRPDFDHLLGQVVLPDRILLYDASPQGVRWIQVPVRRQDLLAAAEQLERAVNSPQTAMATVDRAARNVGDMLIIPIAPENQAVAPSGTQSHPAAHLFLEPDPLLGNLPWPSVATASGDLGLQTDLEESPSLVLDRPAQSLSAGRELVVGASLASGNNQLLPEVLQEARSVAQFDRDPSLLLGDQATEPQVVARLGTASAIHFAGHAAQRDGDTRLLLAPEKNDPLAAATAPSSARPSASTVQSPDTPWLDSRLLRKHPPREARLVVFSACSSGKKGAGWDHGMDDIVDTLAALGVPDVVATRWQIDSSAAVPMMDAFYAGLAKGLTVPQSLTAARQSMVRDPRYRHPYYWAAWYASGTGTADLKPIFRPAK